jgi:hypothetical protein
MTDGHYQAIGRLLRACAAIEDCVTLFICGLFGITEGKANILLGLMPISQKLKVAGQAARGIGGDDAKLFNDWLDNEVLTTLLRCRNAMAHGILLGQSGDGELAFRTNSAIGIDVEQLQLEVLVYDLEMLKNYAEVAERGASELPEALGLQSLLDKRLEQPLGPHPKSQPKKKRDGGQSSRSKS